MRERAPSVNELSQEVAAASASTTERSKTEVIREMFTAIYVAHFVHKVRWEALAERFNKQGFPIGKKVLAATVARISHEEWTVEALEDLRAEATRQRIAQRRADATAEAPAPRRNRLEGLGERRPVRRTEGRTRLTPRSEDGLTMAERKDRDAKVLQQLQEDTLLPEFPQEKKKKP